MLTSSERSLLGKAAAHESWAHTENRTARTAPARAALDAKFLEQAGGDPVRAIHLRKAHFAKLALKSAQSRRRARELTEEASLAEAELAEIADDHERGGRMPPDGPGPGSTALVAHAGSGQHEPTPAYQPAHESEHRDPLQGGDSHGASVA